MANSTEKTPQKQTEAAFPTSGQIFDSAWQKSHNFTGYRPDRILAILQAIGHFAEPGKGESCLK